MSYDIRFVNPRTKRCIRLAEPLLMPGGTYQVGGTMDASINVTYNYSDQFRKVFGEHGIRALYGKTAKEIRPLLVKATMKLGMTPSGCYWDATPGNAGQALNYLLRLASTVPQNSILEGD